MLSIALWLGELLVQNCVWMFGRRYWIGVYCTLRRTLREDVAVAALAAAPQAVPVLRFMAKGNSGGMEHNVMGGMILKSLGS